MKKLTRRDMLRLSAVVGAGTLAAACGATPTAAPTAAPAATDTAAPAATNTGAPAATDTAAPTTAAATDTPAATVAATAATGGTVPRNRTLMLINGGTSGKFTTMGLINPVAGMNHQEGMCLLWDPLFYYSVFADKNLPWLAESGTYNSDYTQLTLKLRNGIEWSDGQPITSADVKFTLDSYKANNKINYHGQVNDFVQSVDAPDDQTVVIHFTGPQPRFMFEYLSFKFDTGDPSGVLPMHALKDAPDITTVQGKDSSFPHSGMFNVTQSPEQYVFDLRPDWWGFKTGFQKVPDVKRVILQPVTDMTTAAQAVVNNQVDATLDLRAANIRSAVQQNPTHIITYTGHDEPLGNLDWWPNSLWMNDQLAPYSDKTFRWAINYSIDRDTIDKVVYLGAKISTIFPYPQYPALNKYLTAAQPIADKLGVRTFDINKTADNITKLGYTKDSQGLWAKGGKRINATVDGFASIHADIVPVLVEMLRKGGFEAAINFGNDAGTQMANGAPGLYMFGHGASVIDPYATLLLYHSKYAAPLNTPSGNNAYSRYKNPAFDKLVDAMQPLAPGDPKIMDLFLQAMTIYWTDMIDVPIIQWLHRIPMNTTYWTNWPTQDNPYLNPAFWHWTFPIIILNLKAVQ